MKEITTIDEFKTITESGQPALLDFYADWCGPCQTLLPVIEDLAKEYEGEVTIAKVNVDDNRELAMQFRVRSIPALFFIENGEVADRLQGLQPKSTLKEKLDNLRTKPAA